MNQLPRRMIIRPDWPPGSNRRLLAEREHQAQRYAKAVAERVKERPTALPPKVQPLGDAERLLKELLHLAHKRATLPPLRSLATALGYEPSDAAIVRRLVAELERAREIVVTYRGRRANRIDAIKLANGRVLERATPK